jgi:hypothetical protein
MQNHRNAVVRLLAGAAMVAAMGLTSGCMSSPTYGTDKSSSEQLATDLTNIFSFTSKKREPIDYTPRPELVKPVKAAEGGETTGSTAETVAAPAPAVLPPPQETVATAENPNWPESPEQRLARIHAEADANVDDPNYKSPVIADQQLSASYQKVGNYRADDSGIRNASQAAAENEEFKRRLKEQQQGSSTSRKYLSEPPLDYREAYVDAPQGELGEDEAKKERRLKREARKKGERGSFLDDINPF